MTKAPSTHSRAREFAEVDQGVTRDFDPEDDVPDYSESDGSESGDAKRRGGREHYGEIAKSKLRHRDIATLGPQYTGSQISREGAFNDGLEHDPFADHESGEESLSAEDFTSGTAKDISTGSDSETFDEYQSQQADERDGESSTDDTSVDRTGSELEDEDEGGDTAMNGEDQDAAHRAQLRQVMIQDRSHVAETIAQANKVDAEKGTAVKKQRQTFDTILNSRIRLQQGLIAINTLPTREYPKKSATDVSEIVAAAELAAVKLWNTIETLKNTLHSARAGTKRKHHEITLDNTISETWRTMQEYETKSRTHRRAVLQKWSAKTQSASIQPASRKLIGDSRQATIINVLDEHLSNKERLVKRTRIPRSCAPVQASVGHAESVDIFDDADFYGILLKELLDQRSIDSGNVGSDMVVNQWDAVRTTKVKKKVDTKASKGRKLRYTVHEKLQNFMAPEDRRTWTERQIDELFGSLLGRRLALAEVEDEQDINRDGAEEEALKLFRS